MGDDSSWKYDSYEDHSDLSGMLASNRDSVSEEEQEIVHDDGKVSSELPDLRQIFFSVCGRIRINAYGIRIKCYTG